MTNIVKVATAAARLGAKVTMTKCITTELMQGVMVGEELVGYVSGDEAVELASTLDTLRGNTLQSQIVAELASKIADDMDRLLLYGDAQ